MSYRPAHARWPTVQKPRPRRVPPPLAAKGSAPAGLLIRLRFSLSTGTRTLAPPLVPAVTSASAEAEPSLRRSIVSENRHGEAHSLALPVGRPFFFRLSLVLIRCCCCCAAISTASSTTPSSCWCSRTTAKRSGSESSKMTAVRQSVASTMGPLLTPSVAEMTTFFVPACRRKEADVTMEGHFLIRQIYDDEITYNIVGVAARILSQSKLFTMVLTLALTWS